MLNIPSYIKDQGYRYRMPKMQLKKQGRGGSQKVKILNIENVAEHLMTHEAFILKFLGQELGSQTTKPNIIKGHFQQQHMQKLLDKFIQIFILCQECRLPQIKLFERKEKLYSHCFCCSHQAQISNKHKLAKYILNNAQLLKNIKRDSEKCQKFEHGQDQQTKKSKKQQSHQCKNKKKIQTHDQQNVQIVNIVNEIRDFIKTKQKQKYDFYLLCAQTVEKLKMYEIQISMLIYIVFSALLRPGFHTETPTNISIYKKLLSRVCSSLKFESLLRQQQFKQMQTLINIQHICRRKGKQQQPINFYELIQLITKSGQQYSFQLQKTDESCQKILLTHQLLQSWSSGNLVQMKEHFLFDKELDQQLRQNFNKWHSKAVLHEDKSNKKQEDE